MKRRLLAALLSAFILPGAGQIYNRQYWKGGVIASIMLFSTGGLLIKLARDIIVHLQLGNGYLPSWESIFLVVEWGVYQKNKGWILGYIILFLLF